MTIGPADFIEILRAVSARVRASRDELCALDGAIGDGDHGVTMATGWAAIDDALHQVDVNGGFAPICNSAAKAFLTAVGGSAGPLYATALMRGGAALKDRAILDGDGAAAFIAAAAEGVTMRGQAAPGDKTMLDAWQPAADAARRAFEDGADLPGVLRAAADAAAVGRDATATMAAKIGRASRLGDRALGHVDPGAASSALILAALADAVAAHAA